MDLRFHPRWQAVSAVAIPLENPAKWPWGLSWGGAVSFFLGLLFAVSSLQGEPPRPTESQVQAAYLYNFGRFVRWPDRVTEAKSEPFVICVFGQDPFGPALDAAVAGGTIAGKEVVAKRISVPRDAVNCQILFISSSEESRLDKIFEAVGNAAILTVSDMPQFSERGGMIHFLREGNRVRFEVNLAATRNVGLTLSSELLKVAATVRKNRSPGG